MFDPKYVAAWKALDVGTRVEWGGNKSTRSGVVVWKQPDEQMGYPVAYASLMPAIQADLEALGDEDGQLAAWSLVRQNPSALVRDDKRSRRGEVVYRMVKVSRLREAMGDE
jgi:hypothetical protein